MDVTVETVIENFKKAYPSDTFLVYISSGGGTTSFYGTCLLHVKLDGEQWLDVFKLSQSSGISMTGEDVKAKAFPFVYDSKSESDVTIRRDILRNRLKSVFPNHHVNIFVCTTGWRRNSSNIKGSAFFQKEYGSTVDIILS